MLSKLCVRKIRTNIVHDKISLIDYLKDEFDDCIPPIRTLETLTRRKSKENETGKGYLSDLLLLSEETDLPFSMILIPSYQDFVFNTCNRKPKN